MTGYVLTTAAESDLHEIIRYTRKQWGDVQVRRYITMLERGIVSLVNGRSVFKEMSTLFPGLRMGRYKHHYVFCLLRKGEPALVVAIFHERMNLMVRLVDRLKE